MIMRHLPPRTDESGVAILFSQDGARALEIAEVAGAHDDDIGGWAEGKAFDRLGKFQVQAFDARWEA